MSDDIYPTQNYQYLRSNIVDSQRTQSDRGTTETRKTAGGIILPDAVSDEEGAQQLEELLDLIDESLTRIDCQQKANSDLSEMLESSMRELQTC